MTDRNSLLAFHRWSVPTLFLIPTCHRLQTPAPPGYDAATGGRRGATTGEVGDDGAGDLSSISGDLVIEEEDLGWGEEGSLDDYAIDLGSMVVPQVGAGHGLTTGRGQVMVVPQVAGRSWGGGV